MSKPNGRRIGLRIDRDTAFFEYRYQDRYVRQHVSMADLTLLLTNGINHDSNLGAGAQPINLEPFLTAHYLPRCARPRLQNQGSLNAETDLAKALARTLGATPVHEIRSSHAEKHKAQRLAEGCANNTVKKELRCLGRAMSFAVLLELIKKNVLPPVKGLPSADRSWIWLRLPQIERLLTACPQRIRLLTEFLILTGARIGEALLLQVGDVDYHRGVVLIPTEKQKRPARDCRRKLAISDLGPRFSALLRKMSPDPKTGNFFPIPYQAVSDHFVVARERAGLREEFKNVDFHVHDLRGTFAVHRGVVVKTMRQLEAELGHNDWKSLQSYLDRADQLAPEESIFYAPPPQPAPPPPADYQAVSEEDPPEFAPPPLLH